jgi:hypothetical protein
LQSAVSPSCSKRATSGSSKQQQQQQQQQQELEEELEEEGAGLRVNWSTSWQYFAAATEQQYMEWQHKHQVWFLLLCAGFILLHLLALVARAVTRQDVAGHALYMYFLAVKSLPYWPLLVGRQQAFLRYVPAHHKHRTCLFAALQPPVSVQATRQQLLLLHASRWCCLHLCKFHWLTQATPPPLRCRTHGFCFCCAPAATLQVARAHGCRHSAGAMHAAHAATCRGVRPSGVATLCSCPAAHAELGPCLGAAAAARRLHRCLGAPRPQCLPQRSRNGSCHRRATATGSRHASAAACMAVRAAAAGV